MSVFKQLTRQQLSHLLVIIFVLFFDMVLYSFIIPMVPYLKVTYTLNASMMGILFSMYAISLFLTTPFFGRLTDRVGRKYTILIGLFSLTVSTLLFAFSTSIFMLLLARFIQGAAAAASWTAGFALLADLFHKEQRGPVMGIALTGISTGTLLGAPISGFLFDLGGYQLPFIITASGLFILSMVTTFILKEPIRQKQETSTNMRSLLKNKTVIFILAIILLGETTLVLLEPLLPVFISERFHVSSSEIGLIFAIITIGYGMMAPISGALSNHLHPHIVMIGSLIILAFLLPWLVFTTSLWQTMFVGFLVGAMIGAVISPTMTSLGEAVDENNNEDYGTAYGLSNMALAVGMMIGPTITGVLADMFSIPTVMIVISISLFLSSVLLSIVDPKKQILTKIERN